LTKRIKKLSQKQLAIQWRRAKCVELLIAGNNFSQIAEHLKVSNALITMDFAAIRSEAQERLNNVIEKELPLQWLKTRTAIQLIQQESLRMFREAKTDNIRLAALQAFGNAQREEFALISNSDVLDKCMQYVFDMKNNSKPEQEIVEKE
jgi:hypothetical protein